MSAVPAYTPIIRRVNNGTVTFDGVEYPHEKLERHNGSDVFCDMEVDVDTEKSCYRIYDAWENEICVIELDSVESIGEAANVKGLENLDTRQLLQRVPQGMHGQRSDRDDPVEDCTGKCRLCDQRFMLFDPSKR